MDQLDERDFNGNSQILKRARRLGPNGLVTGEHWRMSFQRVEAEQRTVACAADTRRPKFGFSVHAHEIRFLLRAFLLEGLAQKVLCELNWLPMLVVWHQTDPG